MLVPKILVVSLLAAYGARVRYQGLLPAESLLETSISEADTVAKPAGTVAMPYFSTIFGWMTSPELPFEEAKGGFKGAWNGVKHAIEGRNDWLGKLGKKMVTHRGPGLQESYILDKQKLLGRNVLMGALGIAQTMYVNGKILVEKNKAQKELMLSDLMEEFQEPNDSHKDVELSAAALDFASSNSAFNVAEQAVWDQAMEALSISTVPTSAEACHARFDEALEPLRRALCQATCRHSNRNCDCDAKDFESPLDEPMKKLPTTICDSFLSWKGTATEQELERFWPRHLDQLRHVVRKVLAENFPSPALMATSTEAMLIDFSSKISTSCALNSSWWNPLGKAANATRSLLTGADRQAIPRDIVAAKVAQIQKVAHEVTCPALRLSMCRAGCPGYETCAESVYEEDFVAAFSYKPVYCRQMLDFNSRVEPLCTPGWSNVKALAKASVSVASSWLIPVAMTYKSYNEGLALVPYIAEYASWNTLPAYLLAVQATTHLLRHLVAGWQDGSEACTEIAKKIMEGSLK